MTSKRLSTRQWVLGAALVASLAATFWAAQSEDDPAAAAQPVVGSARRAAVSSAVAVAVARAASAAEVNAPTDWQPVQRKPWAAPPDAQFAAWAPPPPPPAPREVKAPPPLPPAPVAPPFPYQIIGSLVESGQTQVFLAGPARSLNVRAGELIDGQWRVDQVSATGMSLTWLPAQIKQQIAFRALPP
jgi:hypothetical protein